MKHLPYNSRKTEKLSQSLLSLKHLALRIESKSVLFICIA